MTDLRTVLHEIAADAPHLDATRRRLRRPRWQHAPVLAAAGVILVAVAVTATALLTGHGPAASDDTAGVHPSSSSGTDAVETAPTTGPGTAGDTPGASLGDPATAADLVSAAPTDPWAATCFGAADLTTDLRVGVALGQKAGEANIAPGPGEYLDICGSHWQTGTWSADAAVNPDYSAPPAPEDLDLIGCVLPDGSYGIFPGTATTCGTLGLPVAVAPDPQLAVIESPSETN